jgi:hypothetical protein
VMSDHIDRVCPEMAAAFATLPSTRFGPSA